MDACVCVMNRVIRLSLSTKIKLDKSEEMSHRERHKIGKKNQNKKHSYIFSFYVQFDCSDIQCQNCSCVCIFAYNCVDSLYVCISETISVCVLSFCDTYACIVCLFSYLRHRISTFSNLDSTHFPSPTLCAAERCIHI